MIRTVVILQPEEIVKDVLLVMKAIQDMVHQMIASQVIIFAYFYYFIIFWWFKFKLNEKFVLRLFKYVIQMVHTQNFHHVDVNQHLLANIVTNVQANTISWNVKMAKNQHVHFASAMVYKSIVNQAIWTIIELNLNLTKQ